MTQEQKVSPQRSIDLLNRCIEGLEIAVDWVSSAVAVSSTYQYLGAEKGLDYKLHEENFLSARYILEELHKMLGELPDAEESQELIEKIKRESTPLEFVKKELQRSITGMTVSKNKLEASLSMYEALSQLNLDEDGFRYKFSIEEHAVNLITINDAISEFLEPVLKKAFRIRKSRTDKLKNEYKVNEVRS